MDEPATATPSRVLDSDNSYTPGPEARLGELLLRAGDEIPDPLCNKVGLDIGDLISDVVCQIAEKHPGRTAVVGGGTDVDYRGLVRMAERLERGLVGAGVAAGDVVACRGPRSATTVALFLAIERIGAVYLPLDPAWPDARTTEVLDRARAAVVVDHDGAAETIATRPGGAPVPAGRGDEPPRYVIFTSGTTGQPKGAVVARDGMLNHLWAKVNDLGLGAGDVLALTAPPVFDISVWQMLAPLLVGGRIAVVSEVEVRFPRRLRGVLTEHGVTVVELVPTAIGLLLDEIEQDGVPPPALRWLISTGEELTPALAGRVLSVLPGVALLNAYGPTECSDDVTHHVVTRADTGLVRCPVGRPIGNAVVYCLEQDPRDGTWSPAADGATGELFVGGVPVGLGYVGDPERTSAAFFRDPFDPLSPTGRLYRTGDLGRIAAGVVHYSGRIDRQVKVDGVRMELDEIESVLGGHPRVSSCAVTVSDPPRRRLTAHCVTDGAGESELEAHLRERLPAALVPRVWDLRTELPVTRNGKIDRHALRADVRTRGR